MRKPVLPVVILLLAGWAQAQRSNPGRIVTTSRLVTVFSAMEQELVTALQQNHKAAIDRLLSEDFEVWTPSPDRYPVSREDWLAQHAAAKSGPVKMRQWAVKDLGTSRAVSFLRADSAGEFFIVDIWQNSGGDVWKLTDRYVSGLPKK